MIEFVLNRLPDADIEGFVAFGRPDVEEDGAQPVLFAMVPEDIWIEFYGNAKQINVQLTR